MGRHIGKPNFGISGPMAEVEILGEVRESVNFEKWREKKTYMTYRESMEAVRKSQLGDPTDPSPRFANDLHATVAERISPDDYSRVRFFTAIGSNFDFQHGIDGFFEIDTDDGEIEIVTMDVKTYDPLREIKADTLIVYPQDGLDPKIDKKRWNDLVAKTADDIIRSFNLRRKAVAV